MAGQLFTWLFIGLLCALALVDAKDIDSPEGFTFENDKTLLFTIRSNIGEDPQAAFVTRGNGNRPAPSPNEPLPAVYRSDLLDDLPGAVRRLGKTKLVAEMRVDRAEVMRIVFDVGDNTDSLNQFNWFSPSRLIGSWPYRLDEAEKFLYFSIKGDENYKRRFIIAKSYDGCERDRGFWLLSGVRDGCGWANRGWKGLAPVLVYNRFKDRTLHEGADFADQFLVYLTDTVDDFRAEFRKPFFHVERKQLLYTIKSNIHKSALETFREQQNYRSPIDDKLPILYRSDLLDDLSRAVKDSGMTQMVLELVKDDTVAAQLVFNVTKDVDSLTLENWFSPKRLESSYPYHVDKSKFNFFSIEGDKNVVKRHFYISYNYGGCENDAGFIAIADTRDGCDWANRNWRGSPPLLMFNRQQGKPFHVGVDTADRMLVYLTYDVEDKRWEFRQPFIVDEDKQILFTIKSGVGKEAKNTFKHQQDYPIPSDHSLPPIYRSDLLDQLDKTVQRSGRSKMIAEMRKDDEVVARLVFDVSTDTDSLNLVNWFSRDRLLSAYPYQISKKIHLNYFSVDGDSHRGFSVTDTGKGCDNDLGFWMVLDKKDSCNWGSAGWQGAAPVLAYNRYRTATLRSGVDYADRFVVYLTNYVDELRRDYKKSIIFEKGKQLLFTIVPNVHQEALETFEHQQNYKMPADGSLPPIYRSDLIDELPRAVKQSGMTKMVVEMRKDNQVVSQVVFDVSTDTDKLDKENWFSLLRLESSYPYPVSRKEFNYFSLEGEVSQKRRFFISNNYGGCERDAGFIMVSDYSGHCDWVTRGWRGSAPTLIYNKEPGRPFHESAGYADRLLIYLSNDFNDPRAEFKKFITFEEYKQLLFTIEANVGRDALNAFTHKQDYKLPSDGSLPSIYRSDLLDQLALTVKLSRKTRIVVEMREGDSVVSQVIFNVVKDTDKLTRENWFSKERLESSYPFWIGRSEFNQFSLEGDSSRKRHFSISSAGGGCDTERSFFVVSDKEDACPWISEGFKGSVPVLVYNYIQDAPSRVGSGYADRLLVYLM